MVENYISGRVTYKNGKENTEFLKKNEKQPALPHIFIQLG